ncbi:MAG: GntR family transcriptional regulator [Bacteroidota bacterium]
MKNLPQYRLVYEKLRKHIVDGLYNEGDMLPSESELCALHQVTRPTVRKALDRLLNEGYIKKQQGKGSIVRGKPKGAGILSITGITSVIGQEKLQTRIIVKPEIRKFEQAFTFELTEYEKESGGIYMERLRLVNAKPVFYDITILPNINLPRFTSRNFENNSLFDVLRRNYQIEVRGGEQQMLAKLPDKHLQKYFKIDPQHPIIQLNRKFETSRLNYNFYSQVFCNTDEYMLEGKI